MVVWLDAYEESAVLKGGTVEPKEVATVGWLTRKGKVLNVAAEDTGDYWRAVTAIPRSLVVRVVPLTEGDS